MTMQEKKETHLNDIVFQHENYVEMAVKISNVTDIVLIKCFVVQAWETDTFKLYRVESPFIPAGNKAFYSYPDAIEYFKTLEKVVAEHNLQAYAHLLAK